jgi:hypothetical protein
MRDKNKDWNVKSVSYWLTAGTGLFLLGLGVNGMARPVAAAEAFGLPLKDAADRDYVRVKADRDISTGLTVLALLGLKMKNPSRVFLVISLIQPLTDALLVASTDKLSNATKAQRLPIHLSAVAYIALTVLALGRKRG